MESVSVKRAGLVDDATVLLMFLNVVLKLGLVTYNFYCNITINIIISTYSNQTQHSSKLYVDTTDNLKVLNDI